MFLNKDHFDNNQDKIPDNVINFDEDSDDETDSNINNVYETRIPFNLTQNQMPQFHIQKQQDVFESAKFNQDIFMGKNESNQDNKIDNKQVQQQDLESKATNNRQKILEMQKQKLLDNQKLQFKNQGMLQSNDIKRYGINQIPANNQIQLQNNQKEEIDIERLKKMIQQNGNQQYEPGQFQTQKSSIPSLKKTASVIRQNQNDDDKDKFEKDKVVNFDDNIPEQNKESESQTIKEDQQSQSTIDQLVIKDSIQLINRNNKNSNDSQTKDLKILTQIQFDNIKTFIHTQCKQGYVIQCQIVRNKSGLDRFFPKYECCLSDGKFILAAQKKAYNTTSNYQISIDKNKFDKNSPSSVGKLRSNFLGTEFNIYDSGKNHKKSTTDLRHNLGTVTYESNIMGQKGPRRMKAYVPEYDISVPAQANNNNSIDMFKFGTQKVNVYENKTPKWNEHVQAYVLNFNGRVDKPSVKNFQLIDETEESHIYLQFGRVGSNVFNMDFTYPFTPLQAFAVCLSSFDNKMACE